jgi:hypothetical protein
MLAKGYRIGASMDQDNHNMTFGTANSNRLVLMTPAKTRAEVVNAIRNMRFYASQDCNVRIDFKTGTSAVGSSVVNAGVPAMTLAVTDGDGENVASIELWGGQVGGAVPATPVKTYAGTNNFTFNSGDVENTQPNNTTYYYYLIITQDDGNKMVTSPIWYSRNDVVLPVTWLSFTANYSDASKATLLKWTTAQEFNSRELIVEKSIDGGSSWTVLGSVRAAGSSVSFRHYEFADLNPFYGTSLYRIKQVDIDGRFNYSRTVAVTINNKPKVEFTLRPNPASGFAYIYSTVTTVTKANIQLIDVNGKMISQQQHIIGKTVPAKFDIAGVSPGAYFLRISYEDKITVEKILVK